MDYYEYRKILNTASTQQPPLFFVLDLFVLKLVLLCCLETKEIVF